MKSKKKIETIFVIVSSLFIVGCFIFYGYRLVKYYRVFNPKGETGEPTVLFSAKVRQENPVITKGDGLYISNGNFVFKGENVNNYVSYDSKIYRIMQVNRDGTVTLVLEDSLKDVVYDEDSSTYDKSYIHDYLLDENNFKLKESELEKVTICLDKVDDASKMTCENTVQEYASILSLENYVDSLNSETNLSYLNSQENIWLYNQTSDSMAWNIDHGKITKSDLDFEYALRPVIILKSNSISDKGTGTEKDPYIVKVGE